MVCGVVPTAVDHVSHELQFSQVVDQPVTVFVFIQGVFFVLVVPPGIQSQVSSTSPDYGVKLPVCVICGEGVPVNTAPSFDGAFSGMSGDSTV